MNLDYLTTFVQIVKTGSFSEVAKKLSITQPAVSFQIGKLERDLGVRLMDRSQRPIALTEAGKQLLRFAEVVEIERGKLMQGLEELRDQVTGDLVIAASTIPGEILLPAILGRFKALHPATSARIDVSDSLGVISKVREGTYDVGFCGAAPQGKDLEYFKMAEDEIVLIVFPEHPFADRGKVSFMELEEEPLIMREETSGTQRSLRSLLAKAGASPDILMPTLTLGTTQSVVSAVEAKTGIAFVSSLAIRKSVALHLVKQVKVDGMQLKRDFYCVYRKERVVSRLLTEFISFVQAHTTTG